MMEEIFWSQQPKRREPKVKAREVTLRRVGNGFVVSCWGSKFRPLIDPPKNKLERDKRDPAGNVIRLPGGGNRSTAWLNARLEMEIANGVVPRLIDLEFEDLWVNTDARSLDEVVESVIREREVWEAEQ